MHRCPAGEKLAYHYTNEENGLVLRRYWTNACQSCAIKQRCTTGKERQITRWEHEHVLEAVQKRLDRNPQAMRQRRETAARDGRGLYSEVRLPANEHPFRHARFRLDLQLSSCLCRRRHPTRTSEPVVRLIAWIFWRTKRPRVLSTSAAVCCSIDLTGTKRIVLRITACRLPRHQPHLSYLRFTKGFT